MSWRIRQFFGCSYVTCGGSEIRRHIVGRQQMEIISLHHNSLSVSLSLSLSFFRFFFFFFFFFSLQILLIRICMYIVLATGSQDQDQSQLHSHLCIRALSERTGKPLWSSEDYAADNYGSGGRCEARILNQNWVMGLMTATVNWNLISSYYSFTEWPDDGFSMTARSPWSGFYEVQPPLWAAAHTTQFAVCCSHSLFLSLLLFYP